ncbi:MAG: efflux transporter outer membrane subunit [Campylobacterales bacterium]
MRKKLTVLFSILLLSGCSVAPKLEMPETPLPSTESNVSIDTAWWERYGDPVLDGLIDEALKNNGNLQLAAANVAQARAALGLAKAQRYPNLAANASAASISASEESFGGTGAEYDNYAVSGVLSYEVDLFGRLKDAKNVAAQSLLAMEADRETLKLSIAASVAESYFALLTQNRNLEAAETLLIAKKEGFALRKKQYEKGAIPELLLRQAEADLNGVQAQFEQFSRSRDAAANALSILCGRSPKAIVEERISGEAALPAIERLPAAMPSDLISRRPDILAAEARLKAANYSVGSARAAYFPTLSLTGSTGFQSQELGDLMNSGAATTQLSAGVSVPIFSFGRIGAQVESAKAGKEAALVAYINTLQRAFGEVHDALNRRALAEERLTSVSAQLSALERVLDLTERKYEAGYSDYLAVIDAQSAYLGIQNAYYGAQLELLASEITLIKALGGGWQKPEKRSSD